MEKLRRQRKGKKLTGLCAGIARLIGIDASYVRLAWLAAALVPPFNHLVAIAAMCCWCGSCRWRAEKRRWSMCSKAQACSCWATAAATLRALR